MRLSVSCTRRSNGPDPNVRSDGPIETFQRALFLKAGGGQTVGDVFNKEALEAVVPRVQQELHRLAAWYMRGERPNHPLQTTALINEAYIRLIAWKNVRWQNRAHFFGVSARLMRRILVDAARARRGPKRRGDFSDTSLDEAFVFQPEKTLICWLLMKP